jgi:MoxR-like ATPase
MEHKLKTRPVVHESRSVAGFACLQTRLLTHPERCKKSASMSTRDQILQLKQRMGESIIGQEQLIERLLLTLLANGNLLLEGLPGLAKTRTVKSLARHLESEFRRIQFTPDLLPSDVTGTEVYYDKGGKGSFQFQPGPIFGNLVLADEINRPRPRCRRL